MPVYVTEGVSKSGKTTTLDAANLDGIPITTNRGMDVVGKDGWSDYQWGVLEHAGRIYRQNPDVTFVHDRLLTEAVYSDDVDQRYMFKRAAQSIPNLEVIYFEAGEEVLRDRGTRDDWRLEVLLNRYDSLLGSVDHHRIDTGTQSVEESARQVEEIIRE